MVIYFPDKCIKQIKDKQYAIKEDDIEFHDIYNCLSNYNYKNKLILKNIVSSL